MFVDIADTCKNEWYICKLLINYGFGEAFLEYFESWSFSCENTNIGVPMFTFENTSLNKLDLLISVNRPRNWHVDILIIRKMISHQYEMK
jgi:hypothetical protein